MAISALPKTYFTTSKTVPSSRPPKIFNLPTSILPRRVSLRLSARKRSITICLMTPMANSLTSNARCSKSKPRRNRRIQKRKIPRKKIKRLLRRLRKPRLGSSLSYENLTFNDNEENSLSPSPAREDISIFLPRPKSYRRLIALLPKLLRKTNIIRKILRGIH